MIQTLGISSPLAATPVYTNDDSEFSIWGKIEILVEMATTGVLGVGSALLPVVRWTDANNRSRSIPLASISLLDSSASATLTRPIIIGPSKVVTIEVSVINVISGSYTYNLVAYLSPVDIITSNN